MREIRPSGSEGGARSIPCPYPYRSPMQHRHFPHPLSAAPEFGLAMKRDLQTNRSGSGHRSAASGLADFDFALPAGAYTDGS